MNKLLIILLFTGLLSCKKSTVKSVATTDNGSDLITFKSNLNYGTVKDIDGNSYKTININGIEWMAENLKVTRFNDSTPIPYVSDSVVWGNLSTAGYCVYGNNMDNKKLYGYLYNYYVIQDKNVCPTGWHVPSDQEWTDLTTPLGGAIYAGGQMKEAGDGHWIGMNNLNTNTTGFTALPGGLRDYDGVMLGQRYLGYYWTATEQSSDFVFVRYMHNDAHCERNYILKNYGISIRCLKD